MKVNFRNISFFDVVSIITVACSTSKTIRFEVSDEDAIKLYKAQTNHIQVIEKNDIIEVTLISSNEKFTKLFSTAVENNISETNLPTPPEPLHLKEDFWLIRKVI